MTLVTPWGYTLTEATEYVDLLSDSEFDTFTNSRWGGDARVTPNLKAASSAVRNWCGWHVYPILACRWEGRLGVSQNIAIVNSWRGTEIRIHLPATCIQGVTRVSIGDTTYSDYVHEQRQGILIYNVDPRSLGPYDAVTVEYQSGLSEADIDVVKQLVSSLVQLGITNPVGVNSESADGVSVNYATALTGLTAAGALYTSGAEAISAIRLEGVF